MFRAGVRMYDDLSPLYLLIAARIAEIDAMFERRDPAQLIIARICAMHDELNVIESYLSARSRMNPARA